MARGLFQKGLQMLASIGFALIALTAWAALIWCAWRFVADLEVQMNARALDDQDGFTPSMARWGYVGEKRGMK